MSDPWETIEDEPTEAVKADVNAISKLAIQVRDLKNEASILHAQAKTLEAEADQICKKDLPDLFINLGLNELNGDNYSARLKHIVSATLKDKDAAMVWLDSVGAGDLIKTQVDARFPRGTHDNARELADVARRLGAAVSEKETVHPLTLSKWVREQMADGRNIDESIGVYNATIVQLDVIGD